MIRTPALALSALLLAASASAQTVITTPEGAQLVLADDLSYRAGELTDEQLASSTRALFVQDSMNVFRRATPQLQPDMINFYINGLGLRALNSAQLAGSSPLVMTGVGSGQIKLATGQDGHGEDYDLSGGPTGGTGIRFWTLTYPDADTVRARFIEAGLAAPAFTAAPGGTQVAMVNDPGGFPVEIVIRPGAADNSNDGLGVNIAVSDLETSRAFYRDFVGLDELETVRDPILGITKYPYRHKETTVYLYEVGKGLPANTGSAGIQYVISDAAMVEAKAKHRWVEVQNPLNRASGGPNLTTIWLYDPDHVTNYFAQVGPGSRSAR